MKRHLQVRRSLSRRLARHLALALPLAGTCLLASAQAPVYESRDKAGPVFSDQATPGATRIDLPPPNVIQTPKLPDDPSPPAAVAPPYRSISIVSPANQGTIHSNTGGFDIRVQSTPGLRTGDRFLVKFDGTVLAHDFRGTLLRVTPADWSTAAQPNTDSHTLAVAVVDPSGRVLIESQPVQFYAHRATVGRGR